MENLLKTMHNRGEKFYWMSWIRSNDANLVWGGRNNNTHKSFKFFLTVDGKSFIGWVGSEQMTQTCCGEGGITTCIRVSSFFLTVDGKSCIGWVGSEQMTQTCCGEGGITTRMRVSSFFSQDLKFEQQPSVGVDFMNTYLFCPPSSPLLLASKSNWSDSRVQSYLCCSQKWRKI